VSTILRALQRVEGETGADGGGMGALREGVVSPGEPMVREVRRTWRLGFISLLAVLVFGFFLWRMIPSEEVSQPSAQLPPAVAAPPEPLSEPSSRPAPLPAPRSEEEIAVARPAAPVERVEVSPSSPAVRVPPPRWLSKAPEPSERLVEPLAPASTPPPPAAEPAIQPPPPPAAELAIQPPRPAPAPPAPAPARVATVRPPKVTVEKTVWHPTPGRRVARIEVEGHKGMLELHEGDAVGTLVVAEIQPSGVVFLHGGEKLHRKVGSGR
jgi:hypothetical protein